MTNTVEVFLEMRAFSARKTGSRGGATELGIGGSRIEARVAVAVGSTNKPSMASYFS